MFYHYQFAIIELRRKQGEVFLVSFMEKKYKPWVYIAKAIQGYGKYWPPKKYNS